MSKTITKVIAALGVVAGLGVAALPLSSYAASITSDIPVTVTVEGLFSVAPTDPAATADGELRLGTLKVGTLQTGSDTSSITLTDNNGGTHSLYMGVKYGQPSGANLRGNTWTASTQENEIAAVAAPAAGNPGWAYRHDGGTGTLGSYMLPHIYSAAAPATTGGDAIVSTGGTVTAGLATYQIGATAYIDESILPDTYTSIIQLIATEL